MSVFDERKYPAEMPLAQLQLQTRDVVPNLKAQRQELQMRIDKIDRFLAVLEKLSSAKMKSEAIETQRCSRCNPLQLVFMMKATEYWRHHNAAVVRNAMPVD